MSTNVMTERSMSMGATAIGLVGLTMAAALPLFAADIYLPALPALSDLYGVNADRVQQSMSVFFGTYALSIIALMPFASQLSYRHQLAAGATLVALGALLCYRSELFALFMVGRAVQGVGSGLLVLSTVPTLCTLFSGAALTRAMALYGAVIATAPAASPFAGGLLISHYGPAAISLGVVSYAALAALTVCTTVPSGLANTVRGLSVLRATLDTLREPRVLLLGLYAAGCFFGLFGFITAAPFYFLDTLGTSAVEYAAYQAAVAIAAGLGSLIYTLTGRLDSTGRLWLPLLALAAGIGTQALAIGQTSADHVYPYLAALGLYMAAFGLVTAAAPVEVMRRCEANRTAGAAWFGFITLAFASAGAFYAASFSSVTANSLIAPQAAGWAISAASLLAIAYFERRA